MGIHITTYIALLLQYLETVGRMTVNEICPVKNLAPATHKGSLINLQGT